MRAQVAGVCRVFAIRAPLLPSRPTRSRLLGFPPHITLPAVHASSRVHLHIVHGPRGLTAGSARGGLKRAAEADVDGTVRGAMGREGSAAGGGWLFRCSNVEGAVGARRERTPGVVRHRRRHGDTHPPLGRRTAAQVHAAAARARVVVVEPHMRAVHLRVGVLTCTGRAGAGVQGCTGVRRSEAAVRRRQGSRKAATRGCTGLGRAGKY